MPYASLPMEEPQRIVCAVIAAIKYEIPANILLAVAEKEGGRPGRWEKNTNGTYDVGLMQFNTSWLKDLEPYGIRVADVADDSCYSYDLAAWRLRSHLTHDHDDLWTRAANYHSRTPKYNTIYRADLIKKAEKWQHWLAKHFSTYDVNTPGIAPAYMVSKKVKELSSSLVYTTLATSSSGKKSHSITHDLVGNLL